LGGAAACRGAISFKNTRWKYKTSTRKDEIVRSRLATYIGRRSRRPRRDFIQEHALEVQTSVRKKIPA
jgi:hypothetical protein